VVKLSSLPAKCFISHAYADAAARERFIRSLPATVSPLVFQPVRATPHEFVSNPLIDAIRGCEGLIYLRGGASDRSFWVAFERDYALRSGKPVFCYDITTSELSLDTDRPLDLAVFPAYQHHDRAKVREICQFLGRERSFDVWLDVKELTSGGLWEKETEAGLADRLRRGGYVIAFWSEAASRSRFIEKELATAAEDIDRLNDRVLFTLLDRSPIPDFWRRFDEPSVQLYGDADRSATHRTDDLIVRLYWLIYRKTRSAEATSGR
jgi:predicted transcriptional regulator